jgi:hypothetical protein
MQPPEAAAIALSKTLSCVNVKIIDLGNEQAGS